MSEQITREYFKTFMAEFREGLKADFATKEDIRRFESQMATKEDLRGFTTRADLKGLATKEDLKGFATKEDLRGFARTEDIHRLETNMATKEDVHDLSTQIHASFSNLQSSVDRYLHRTEGWHQEFSVLKGKHEKLSGALIKKGLINEKDTLL
ncbi:MAG: hypothetical protein HY567_03480 [Candidatus Kerfeldbacteria bacterium]|nr:hypothetical protein [Candidatus Kerfeldbacteria bacterium]